MRLKHKRKQLMSTENVIVACKLQQFRPNVNNKLKEIVFAINVSIVSGLIISVFYG